MPLPKTVTAQELVDAVGRVVQDGHFATDQKMEVYPILQALLSRARQEAVEECKKQTLEEWESHSQHEKIQKARRDGRLEGLKEMDEAHIDCLASDNPTVALHIGRQADRFEAIPRRERLRKEYQTN